MQLPIALRPAGSLVLSLLASCSSKGDWYWAEMRGWYHLFVFCDARDLAVSPFSGGVNGSPRSRMPD
jgi:hypothetical protein